MDARSFLAQRRPPAPEALERWLADGPLDGVPVEGLTRRAIAELDRARSAPGRVRTSAYHLLAADALITYACEAALDSADPAAVMETILRDAARGER